MTLLMYTTLRVGSRSTIAVVFSVLLALHKVFIQFHVVCSTIRSGGDLHFLP
jgi:hypothetical protein